MELTQEKPKFPEDLEEQEDFTQEPASLELLVEATTKNQEAASMTQEDVEIENQEDVVTQEPTSSQKDEKVDINGFQVEEDATQEPASP